jgi:hypothetical protein
MLRSVILLCVALAGCQTLDQLAEQRRQQQEAAADAANGQIVAANQASTQALAAEMIAAPAQDHHKNFVECTKELGLQLDPNAQRLQNGRQLRSWHLHSEAQAAAFNDCLSRKANLPSAKGPSRVSQ